MICIIGAGPIGLHTALFLSRKGVKVTVFEEHEKIGLPMHCAGLISTRCYELTKHKETDYVENKVRGAIIFSPTGANSIIVERKTVQAYVIDRSLYDRGLYEIALSEGVDVKTSCKVRAYNNGRILFNNAFLKVDITVDAEGARYYILKHAKLSPPKKHYVLSAIQYEITNIREVDPDYVQLFLGEKWAPNFFAWVIPLDEKKARVGIASIKKPVKAYLDNFIKKHPIAKKYFYDASITRILVGRVITSGPLQKTSLDNFIAIGDAGGFTKPTTGGGLYYGFISAKLASECILNFLEGKISSLKEFDKMWRREIGKEIYLMKVLRDTLWSLNDKELEELLLLVKEFKIDEVISQIGDMDFQSTVIKNAFIFSIRHLYNSRLRKILMKALRNTLKKENLEKVINFMDI